MTAVPEERVAVEQVDRQTYEAYIRSRNGSDVDEAWIAKLLAGERDQDHGVQIAALARHRLLAIRTADREREVRDLIAAIDAWQNDPTPEAEQSILDARDALAAREGGRGVSDPNIQQGPTFIEWALLSALSLVILLFIYKKWINP